MSATLDITLPECFTQEAVQGLQQEVEGLQAHVSGLSSINTALESSIEQREEEVVHLQVRQMTRYLWQDALRTSSQGNICGRKIVVLWQVITYLRCS